MIPNDVRAWWSPPCVIHDLHDGSCLVHDIVGDRVRLLSRSAATCLAAVHRAGGGQADSLAQRIRLAARVAAAAWECEPHPDAPSPQAAPALSTFSALFDDEWIVTPRACLERLRAAEHAGGGSVSCVAVVTKQRLPLLRRALTAILDNRRQWGRTYRLAVFDNTVNPTYRARTREALAHLAREYAAPIDYADLDVKRALVASLARRTGVDPGILEFGVLTGDGPEGSYGANLNSFLLHAAGQLALCLDDDVVCRLGLPAGARPDTLRFSAESDPTHFRFHRTRQQAFDGVTLAPVDAAGVHEQVLGKSLGAVAVSHTAHQLDPALPARLMKSILLGRGRIAVTWMGLAGDNAMGSPHDLLLLKDACLGDLSSVVRDTDASVTRNVVRSSRATTVTSGGSFMNPMFGVDHRSPLPPFIPRFRNCDGLFSVCVPACLPHGYFAHLPYVVAHDPTEERRWERADLWRRAGTLRVNDHLILTVAGASHIVGTTDDEEQRIVSLGLYCDMLGRQPFPVFRDLMRTQYMQLQHRRLSLLTARLDERRWPNGRWAEDIRRQIEAIRAALTGDAFAPADVDSGGSPEHAFRHLQDIVLRFGGLLGAWPAICREGRALASELPGREHA